MTQGNARESKSDYEIRLRVKSKGQLISTKTINEEEFKDYLATAATIASIANAPGEIVKDVAFHTKAISAEVILSNGRRVHIVLQKVKVNPRKRGK